MNKSKKVVVAGVVSLVVLAGVSSVVFSHCEIPCGIYNDPMRLDLMAEHITTIEKSMNEIQRLSKEPGANPNQLIRWVNNKEHHADEFTHIVTQYFLTQRIKPAPETDAKAYHDYVHKVTGLHQMMIAAMKCKQTTDLENVAKLKSLLAEFRTAYLGPEAPHTHTH